MRVAYSDRSLGILGTCFRQFDSVDGIHGVGLESSAFIGHSRRGTGSEFDPASVSLIPLTVSITLA